MNEIVQPVSRTPLRRMLGKEFYCLKRRIGWWFGNVNWAKVSKIEECSFLVFEHRSLILRPLKDVDMQLQENKRVNLALAIRHLDGMVIRPNETFSIWKNVGRTTKRKGYLPGLILNQGKIATGTGGGLCQLGNLLTWIIAHSPLTITERFRHSYDVFPDVNRKVPFGAGATLSYNYIDFQFKNTTKYTFQLKLWMDDRYLYGALFSNESLNTVYRVEERDHIMKQQMWGGYSRHNRIVQIATTKDTIVENELFVNHAIMMYNPFLTSTKKSDL